ncbi:cell wall-binding repeat-containing protein [Cryobacterium sp. 5B3]|uniref:cell wall-binding repeat-containing protein n=1 Tax=Cryobacterium sp. 5B3 TaxID=3048586 RepID=UPI002AB4FE6D|nr:cell wall-binding repeat-containing protein [Cryobacterium sp. 5B3]MDY7540928.1 cell wall-binding repeat-containing protein [Cryobacterium sp. 5B3]MEB0276151.1 cell wall-binding repeat-containing protein [Cryobacterium sp. 5B3]
MAGSYKVGFVGYDSNSGLVPQYFDNVGDLASATPVTVVAASNRPGINAELTDAAFPTPTPTATPTPTPTPAPVVRLSGSDRFDTSAAISSATFDPDVSVAYIANGSNFPDALSTAPVAGKDKSPVLLVPADSIPAPIQAELARLKPKRIVVLGGANAVSDTVTAALQAYTSGAVTRAAGADRFSTSVAISAAGFDPAVPVAYIANGNNFPDALSAAPVAGKNGAPVLLVPSNGIPDVIQAELTRLKPGRVVVLGGVNAVSDTTAAALKAYTAGAVTRVSGADRFATSAAISQATFDPAAPVVYVANAYNFPDALSGAPVAGLKGAPVLLVPSDSIPDVIQAELTRLKPGRVVILGGPNAVADAVAQQLNTFVTK